MVLPSNVSYGTVTGTFLQAVADSTDAGRDPDGLPVTDLQVKFTAYVSPAVIRDTSSTPPTMIVVQPIIASVDAGGQLIGADGQPGVTLLASTNPAISPTGWTWQVTLSSATFPALTFAFLLDPGATVDLATVTPVAPSSGSTGNGNAGGNGNGNGTTPALSNTAVPTVTGTTTQGQTLTATAGSWSAVPDSTAYQWNRSGSPIIGATGSTYVLTGSDVGATVTVTATASKAGYTSASATSTATATIAASSGSGSSSTVGTATVGTATAA